MAGTARPEAMRRPRGTRLPIDSGGVLNALPGAVMVVDGENRIRYLNAAAEQLLQGSATHLADVPLARIVPPDHPLFGLLTQVRETGGSLSEHDVSLGSPRFFIPSVSMQVAPLAEDDGHGGDVVVVINQLSIAQKIDQQLTHRHAARSVAGMAAILAHEVKNPLAGIRGAAQLIEERATPADRELTRLICDETDRICALVDHMGIFADQRPVERRAVNIHQVLEHVRRIAQTGFGRRIRFVELYDPSLPATYGSRDQLVQVFLNIVKNAVEAAPAGAGEIVISTAYRHGIRLAVKGTGDRVALPLVVCVQDNGAGIPEDLAQHLFDPFVTTKPGGHGLGLALVAKIVGEHGGVIEFESEPRRTVFRVMLPVSAEGEPE